MSTAAGDRDEREGANRLNLHEIHRCVPDALMTARTTARKYMPSRTARSVKDIAAITAANKAATTPATTVTTIRRRSRLHPLTDSWEERTAGRNCTCNEQACNRVSRQCLVIRGRSLSPCKVPCSVCQGRFAFRKTLFSIALFSLCSLIVAWKSLDLLLSPLHINRINQRSRSSCHPPQ